MAGHQEPVMMQKRGSSGLSATLAAAGLADPDILALAQEADTLVYHSRVAQDGTPLNSTASPEPAAAGRKTVGPPAAHNTSPRRHRTTPTPGAKPVVLPTAGTGYAGRTSPIPVKGPSPIYGSKRTVNNSYALSLSRSNSNAGNKLGSSAPSRNNSGAGHKAAEVRNETSNSSSAGYKPSVGAAVSAYNAAARTGSSALPRSRNNSNAGYALSSSPSRSNSNAGSRKPGSISSFPTRTGGAIGSKIPSSSSARSAVSAFAAASGAGDNSSSKVILHSTFSIGHDESMARSASMGPSSGGAAPNAGSIGAFPNTLHRRTASLPCWPNDSTAVSTAASAMEVELEEAFVAAVASGENFSSDDGLEVTLASPPTVSVAGNSASVPTMTSTLERAQLAGAREVEFAAAAAQAESAYAAAAASHKCSDEGEMAGSSSSTIALGSGYAAASSFYSSPASNHSNDISSPNAGRSLGYSSSSSSSSAAATPKAGSSISSIASSMFVANPRQAAQPAALLKPDDYSTAADGSASSIPAAAHSSGMTYKPDAEQMNAAEILDLSVPGTAVGGSYAEGLRQRSGSGIAPAAASASLATAEDDCAQQSSVFDVSYQLGGKLPVLTEELQEKESAASSATNTGATNTGGSAAGGNWWNLSSRRVHPQQSNNTSRGGAEESTGQLPQDDLKANNNNSNNNLSRNSMRSEQSTARPSSTGVKGEKRVSEVSVYTEKSLDPEAASKSGAKRKRWLCLLLPLLLLLSATGVFVGLYVTKQLQPRAAAGAGGPLTFQVTVAAPARTASESCNIWFGSSERIGLYKRLFASAYSNALDLPITDTTVNSVACGGNSVFSSTGVRTLRSSRALLQAAAAAGTGGSTLTWVDITTVFSVSAPADARVQKTMTETVTSSSSGILAGPLSQFLGVNTLLVKASGAVKDAPAATAALPKAAGSDWPQVPVLAVDERPETGALSAEPSATNNAAAAQPSLTQSNQRRSGTEEPKQPVEVIPNTDNQPSKKQQQQPKRKQQPSAAQVSTAAVAASKEPTELQLSTFPWNLMAADAANTAPTCQFSPTRSNTVSDLQGRLWSLMNGKECTFKAAPAASRKAAEAAGAELSWEGAPLCTAAPSKATAVADAAGNLWGFEEGSSCTYKDESGSSLKLKNKPASLPMLWEQTPICDFAPSKENSTADVLGRLWGVDSKGRGCTFRFVEA